MVWTTRLLPIVSVAVFLQGTAAPARAECIKLCSLPTPPFRNCNASTVDHPKSGRIGITGRVVEAKTAQPSCNTRVSIEVIKASVQTLPSRIDIEVDGCARWVATTGDVINVHVLALADPGTGSYSVTSCPF